MHERKCFCKKELMKRTAKECVTTSPDTAKTFHPCHDKGEKLLQLPRKFAVAAASSRFNPRPPVIGQLLRGKKSTPWQPDKPIKSPAGVTAAALQAAVGWAEEQWPRRSDEGN
ncbi:uncharacterized protein LOC144300474 isoform X1 [Canis aureus]